MWRNLINQILKKRVIFKKGDTKSFTVLWEPRYIWIGVFWRDDFFSTQVYVTVIPFFPCLVTVINGVSEWEVYSDYVKDELHPMNYNMVALKKWVDVVMMTQEVALDYHGMTYALADRDDRKVLAALGPVIRDRFRITPKSL